MRVLIKDKDIPLLRTILEASPEGERFIQILDREVADSKLYADYADKARELYEETDGDLQINIDDDCQYSESLGDEYGGVWVSGWLWVPAFKKDIPCSQCGGERDKSGKCLLDSEHE